ncbi:WD40 repeat-like protein [Jaminaea rosea]|uniref:WD40 repeat-like protein n=1 Tax=Jaminaea rosea TaxID=1569628 RepID=A0A316US99_9BASI|nr:WD40 repeat-like protein [Jaminaea rosea]PWN27864.1 WD40 repeat-like protein [Jaminaea rosea]
MVRSYLRHEPTSAFGVVTSPSARCLLSSDGKTAYVAALEDVLVWDVRRGEQVAMWHDVGLRSPVTALVRSVASPSTFAVGYEDGSVRIWEEGNSETPSVTFHGHKRAITAMHFDEAGMRLVTASQDTTLILWDLVAESGLFRLKGHRDAITDVAFVPTSSPSPSTSQVASSSSSSSSPRTRNNTHLLSTSKDGLLKLWDIDLQQSIQTVVPGKGELCSLAVLPIEAGDALLLTGNSEGQVKAWTLSGEALASGLAQTGSSEEEQVRFITALGQIEVASKRRVTQMSFNAASSPGNGASASHLAITSSDRSVQIFRLREEEEMRRKMARRQRRIKEKAKGASNGTALATGEDDEVAQPKVTWLDRIEAYTIVRPESGRLRSFAFPSDTSGTSGTYSSSSSSSSGLPILCATSSNSLEIYSIPPPPSKSAKKALPSTGTGTGNPEATLSCTLDLPGHRSESRAVALTSDDSLLASADSTGLLKVWNVATNKCVRTLLFGGSIPGSGYALCVSWLPGDRYVLVGCKDGSLVTFDVPAGEVVEVIKAHDGPLWSVAIHPDGMRCVTASADKDVKFWEFEMRSAETTQTQTQVEQPNDSDDEESPRPRPSGPPRLCLAHTRTLKMTDEVLYARFSPQDGKLLALSLLDNTVKVFFTDSLKFFLSLYGHKLPVLALDISQDGKLCVTCSADRNVKIWGLDFGDCHRSLFAHSDSVMSVAFERGMQGGGLLGGREGASHHFWTVGKDGLVKYWDGDRFELIQTMEGHHGPVWALAVGHAGTKVVSSGADRSLRVWEKGEEPLFLEEEREREQERLLEEADREERARQQGHVGAVGSLVGGSGADGAPQQEEPESGAVTNETTGSLMAGERLMEALDVADAEVAQRAEWIKLGKRGPPPPRNALITAALGPSDSEQDEEDSAAAHQYVLRVLQSIPAAQLEDSLLVLPFEKVVSLLTHMDSLLSQTPGRSTVSIVPLLSRTITSLLRAHHAHIVSHPPKGLRAALSRIRGNMGRALREEKALVGYNVCGLAALKGRARERRSARRFEEGGFGEVQGEGEGDEVDGGTRKRKVTIK